MFYGTYHNGINVMSCQYHLNGLLNVKYLKLLLKWDQVGLISKLNEFREWHSA